MLRLIKLNMTNAVWLPYLNGTPPVLFADFTTEGGSNHYWFNGAQYLGFSAWILALGGTQSRTGPAYFNNSSGFLTQASSGVLRFNYDPVALTLRGALLESTSTNLILQSNNFSTSWSLQNSSVSQNVTGPDGVANSAWTHTSTGSQKAQGFQSLLQTGITLSVYAKAGTTGFLYLSADGSNYQWFNLNTGTVGTAGTGLSSARITARGNGWYRCSVFFAGTSSFAVFGQSDGDNSFVTTNGDSILLWGFQVEALSIATSYIPTTTSTASRSSDLINFPFSLTTFTSYLDTTSFQVHDHMLLRGSSGDINISYDVSTGYLTGNNSTQLQENTQLTTTSAHRVASCGSPTGRFIAYDGNHVISDNNRYTSGSQTDVNVFDASGSFTADVAQVAYWSIEATPDLLDQLTGNTLPLPIFVSGTDAMQLPINCVVAGGQYDPLKKAAGLEGLSPSLRGIFRE